MLVATIMEVSALSLWCKMMKLRNISARLRPVVDWVDAHLVWFFTNGNKVGVEEGQVTRHDDHVI